MPDEERTQAPSKLRRQQARERGQAAHSAELTGAAGLLTAVVLLGFWGDALAASLLDVLRSPLGGVPVTADTGAVVGSVRAAAWGVAWPLAVVTLGGALGALAAHQAQVGGLWAPALLAPNPARLWAPGQGPGLAARAGRGAWSVSKAVLLALVTAWALRSGWDDLQRLAALETPRLAHAAGDALRRAALVLAGATLALGLVDFALQYYRLEALLRLTPEQQREDQRAMEGDPALRARRRRVARGWRGDAPELLAGASLALGGAGGLAVLLGGGPPPRRVRVLAALQGPTGGRLLRAAESAGAARLDAPGLARRLARHPATLPLPPELASELARVWPDAPSAGA
jgi:flagellar biosynthetic protein FlhB